MNLAYGVFTHRCMRAHIHIYAIYEGYTSQIKNWSVKRMGNNMSCMTLEGSRDYSRFPKVGFQHWVSGRGRRNRN